jgi:predicted lipoprotein with Yx(FWY)xxD motif
MRTLRISAALAGLALLAACAGEMGAPARTGDTAMGKVLTDGKGMTLYTFDRDTAGKSNCNGQCAQNWPPLMAAADARSSGDWTVVTRDDGSKMWAYKGKPLYTWVKDSKAGDTTGDGVNNVWHVAKP